MDHKLARVEKERIPGRGKDEHGLEMRGRASAAEESLSPQGRG